MDQIPEPKNFVEVANVNMVGYLPLRDIFGPYFFFPSHCYPSTKDESELSQATRYNSPVVAYVKTGASVEQDIVDQLRSLFQF